MPKKLILISSTAALAAMILLLAACAPTYDSIADQMLVDTQKQADTGLIRLEILKTRIDDLEKSPNASDRKDLAEAEKQASYASNIDFYDKLQSSITTLDTRMTAMPDLSTPSLESALGQLRKNVDEVRGMHQKENILSADYAQESMNLLDQQFKALTVYELTIKSGSKPQ